MMRTGRTGRAVDALAVTRTGGRAGNDSDFEQDTGKDSKPGERHWRRLGTRRKTLAKTRNREKVEGRHWQRLGTRSKALAKTRNLEQGTGKDSEPGGSRGKTMAKTRNLEEVEVEVGDGGVVAVGLHGLPEALIRPRVVPL